MEQNSHMSYENLDMQQLKAMVLLRQKQEQEFARANFMSFVKAVARVC